MNLITAICMALIICVASELKRCPSCTEIRNCQRYHDFYKFAEAINKIDALIALTKAAKCDERKVCCSDFENEIENHPNTNLLPTECGEFIGDRILNGEITELYEFPWVVLIGDGKANFLCDGSMINSWYVLTAAHCIKEKNISFVRVGEYDIKDEKLCCKYEDETCECFVQDIDVSDKIIHPNYSVIPKTQNDIALLRLAKPANFSLINIGAICLPIKMIPDEELYGRIATITGWGSTKKNEESNILKKAYVPILNLDECNNKYNGRPYTLEYEDQWQNKLCAGGNNQDACEGDSGGPLMLEEYVTSSYKYIQLGITSYGAKDCVSKPGVYTDVRKYMKWILDTIKP